MAKRKRRSNPGVFWWVFGSIGALTVLGWFVGRPGMGSALVARPGERG